MALSANSVFEVRAAGNDTNGGGFVTGASGTDYSQQDSKNTVGSDISTTDAVADGTTTITSATANFGTTIVGNIIYLQGGTGSLAAGWYQVTARASTTSITVDRTVAIGTGITMNIGGALASPGMAGGVGLVNDNKVWVKAGTYSITSTSTNVAAGCVSVAVRTIWEGYNATRGDLGTAPVLQASGISTATLFATTGGQSHVRNLVADGASLTSLRGFSFAVGSLYLCGGINCTNSGIVLTGSGVTAVRCYATGCSTATALTTTSGGAYFTVCVAYSNTVTGVGGNAIRCVSVNNSGASSDGFNSTLAVSCTAYNNGRDGFRVVSSPTIWLNCISEANGGYGFNGTTGTGTVRISCATYNNTSGATNGTFAYDASNVTGSGSFFTNAAGADFSLNNTAGAGAAARAAGYPGALPYGGTGYLDIGALQHADPAATYTSLLAGRGLGLIGGA